MTLTKSAAPNPRMRPRVKYPYYDWEDYLAGMYGMTGAGGPIEAMELLRNPSALLDAMRRAVTDWPKAAAHHLTDGGMNQRAWLGWAATGLTAGVPAHVTRAVWWQLTEAERAAANAAADIVIDEYHQGAHAETLLWSDCS